MLDCRHDLLARFEYHAAVPDLASPEINYEQLHQFRYLIRRFLRFSEEAARAAGVESQQHQLLLTIKGMQQSPDGISVTTAAERLQVSHNTAVELVDRAQAAGLVVRRSLPRKTAASFMYVLRRAERTASIASPVRISPKSALGRLNSLTP